MQKKSNYSSINIFIISEINKKKIKQFLLIITFQNYKINCKYVEYDFTKKKLNKFQKIKLKVDFYKKISRNLINFPET